MRTIVVSLDDSSDTKLVLRAAFSLARRVGCSVGLLTVYGDGEAETCATALRDAAAPFSDLAPWTVDVVEGDDPVEVIVAVGEERDALVCMPTRGRGGLSRMLFGSVADGVVRSSRRPTLCLGPQVTHVAVPDERVEILVCTDDSAASPVVFDAAASFASAAGGTCVIAQVVGPDEDVGPLGAPPPRPLGDRAAQHTADGAAYLTSRGVPATAMVLPGRAAGSLVGYAERAATGFIVVGTTGRTGASRVTLGSVAADVIRNAPCPVLVVPTRDAAAV